jgi:hypothetical protein
MGLATPKLPWLHRSQKTARKRIGGACCARAGEVSVGSIAQILEPENDHAEEDQDR